MKLSLRMETILKGIGIKQRKELKDTESAYQKMGGFMKDILKMAFLMEREE